MLGRRGQHPVGQRDTGGQAGVADLRGAPADERTVGLRADLRARRLLHPGEGLPAATIAKQQGRVCRFVSTDADATAITLAVADLPEKSLTNLKDALYERGGSVPTYRVEGYFALSGDVGRADAFADPYWITAQSTLFTEPGGAQPVVDAVRAALQPSASTTATPAG